MGTQELIIALKEGEIFQSTKFRTALKEVDYTVRNIRVKASGEVVIRSEKKSDKFSDLEFKVGDQVFHILLEKGETKEAEKEWIKHEELIAELRAAIQRGKQKLTMMGQILEIDGEEEGVLLEQVSDW